MNRINGSSASYVFKTILIAGLIAGTLDILAACVQFYINTGNGPQRVLEFIASGVYGRTAFNGGSNMMIAGLALHYLIAIIFSAIFVLAYIKFSFLKRHVIVSGLLYGAIVWVVMNRLILPLSNAPAMPFKIDKAIIAMLILMFMIGLPISLVTRKYDPR